MGLDVIAGAKKKPKYSKRSKTNKERQHIYQFPAQHKQETLDCNLALSSESECEKVKVESIR